MKWLQNKGSLACRKSERQKRFLRLQDRAVAEMDDEAGLREREREWRMCWI